MKNKSLFAVILLAGLVGALVGCDESSREPLLEESPTEEVSAPEDTSDNIRLKERTITHVFDMVNGVKKDEETEVIITFTFTGTDAENAEVRRVLSKLEVKNMEDRFIYDFPNDPSLRKPVVIDKTSLNQDDTATASRSEKPKKPKKPKKDAPKKRKIWKFEGETGKGTEDLENIAVQMMLNKNDSTKLPGDSQGHGSRGKEICSWGSVTQFSFKKDQEIHREQIKQITGFYPNIGVYDYIMVSYYNWRMENIPEYRIYVDEIAGTCEEQRVRVALKD